jgi:hypothetical protein
MPQDVNLALDKFYKQSYVSPQKTDQDNAQTSNIQAEQMADKLAKNKSPVIHSL